MIESCGPVIPASVIAAVPPCEHAGIVRLHVGVRAEHRRDPAGQVVGERDLLARRLGVEVDHDHGRLARGLLDQALGGHERALERIQRHLAEQVDHRDAVVDRKALPRRRRREVRGAEDAVGAAQVGREALAGPRSSFRA